MIARPILFSGPMVRALLAGTKTQTRRIMKLPHENPLGQWEPSTIGGTGVFSEGRNAPEQACLWHTRTGDVVTCPYGLSNDLLWVRETWTPTIGIRGFYRATDEKLLADDGWKGPWRPAIHMPRAVSRLTLRVTEIRIERLQAISEADAIAEGIEREGDGWKSYETILEGPHKGKPHPHAIVPNRSPVTSYRELWESLNGKDSWARNDWVWVVAFTVEKRNVDDVLKESV